MSSMNHLLIFLLLATGACLALAQLLSVPSPNSFHAASHTTDLSTRVRGSRHASGFNLAGFNTIGDQHAELLDIVLVASVDGKLHALNRTSGDTIWSLSSSAAAAAAAASTATKPGGKLPNTLAPLVRTQHPDFDPDLTDDGSPEQETYVIEPQTGEIYVLSSPTSPLQRLPFTMPQLSDMVPFRFATGGVEKSFIGRKETSLLLVELETGRVKGVECPWDPFEDLSGNTDGEEDDVDLDELEGFQAPRTRPTEVYIGRTDYHITIHTRPSSKSGFRRSVQNLSYSMYGPNNQDHTLQSIYRRTADDRYIESLPNGKIISFRANLDNTPPLDMTDHFLWARAFPSPIVAVFDVLQATDRPDPYVLLQPRPRLQDIFPDVDLANAVKENRMPNFKSAYVGIVEETGSLFAMSPDRYPLVVFGDANVLDDYSLGRSIDPPPGSQWDFDPERDLPLDVDSIAKRAKLRQLCRSGSKDRRCYVGVRELESSQLSRLLDGAPTVPLPPYQNHQYPHHHHQNSPVNQPPTNGPEGSGNTSIKPPPIGIVESGPPEAARNFSYHWVLTTLASIVLMLLMRAAAKRVTRERNSSIEQPTPVVVVAPLEQNGHSLDRKQDDVPASTVEEEIQPPSKPPVEIVPLKPPAPSEPQGEINEEDPSPSSSSKVEPPSSAPRSRKVSFRDEVVVRPPSRPPSRGAQSAGEDLTGDGGEGEDSDGDGDVPATPGRRKGPRRKRGKKKRGVGAGVGSSSAQNGGGDDEESSETQQGNGDVVPHVPSTPPTPPPRSGLVISAPATPVSAGPSLVVSDTVLGFGSHGTVVFKGSLQGRAVAVKRLLQDFVTLALREVNVLQESDDHPNVIRYYYQESHSNFLYIALELCPASLADVVERPDQFRDISIAFDPKKALRQITSGLRHLHALKIVHRDIKPQNILISHAKKGVGESKGHRMLISDFGLCKKLDLDQTSFLPTVHGAMAAGTVGWRAPEILRGEVKLDLSETEDSMSSRGSTGTAVPEGGNNNGSNGNGNSGKPTRLTKAVDIFALGCLFYYVLTNGSHPFGDRFEREVNILKNAKNLEGLEVFGEEGSEAVDLISKMLSPEASQRPDTSTCLIHPYFWDAGKRLNFLQDASDRFEIMCREPRDRNLVALELGAINVVGPDWNARLDKWFVENLGKFRKYDGKSVQDLLRALRNKKHHYQDLPDNVKRQVGAMPEGFLSYFTKRFPRLFLHVHEVVVSASSLRQESMFRVYFELNE